MPDSQALSLAVAKSHLSGGKTLKSVHGTICVAFNHHFLCSDIIYSSDQKTGEVVWQLDFRLNASAPICAKDFTVYSKNLTN